MVYVKRLLFLIVVISFLCHGLTDSSGNVEKDGELQKDIDNAHGVIERDKRRAASLQRECLDCRETPHDLTHANSAVLRSKRAAKSRITRKSKKRLKKVADAPATNSKSFSNYFSSFWEEAPTSEKQPSDKSSKKSKTKKKSAKKRKKVKPESSSDSKTKDSTLVSYYSNYWRHDKDGAATGSQSSRIDTKNKDKKKILSENEDRKSLKNTQANEKNDSSSLLGHFSSFWNTDESSSSSESSKVQKVPSQGAKTETEKSKNKLEKNKGKPDKATSESSNGRKGDRNKKRKRKKNRVDKVRQDEKKEDAKSASVSKNENREEEGMGQTEKTPQPELESPKGNIPSVSATDEDANDDGAAKGGEKTRKVKIRKTKANKRRLKNKKEKGGGTNRLGLRDNDDEEDSNKSGESIEDDSSMVVKEKSGKETTNPESTEPISEGTVESNKRRNRKGKSRKKVGKKKKKSKPEVNSVVKPVPDTASSIPEGDQNNEAVTNAASTPDSNIIEFQGLKGGVDSELDGETFSENNTPSHQIGTKPNGGEDLDTGRKEIQEPVIEDRVRIGSEKTTVNNSGRDNERIIIIEGDIAVESQHLPTPTQQWVNSATASKPTELATNPSEELKPPTPSEAQVKPTQAKVEKPRRKKVENSSKKLTYHELLTKAESAFRKKNEKIMKKLSALGTKTGKKYKKFKVMSDTLFKEDKAPTASFNASHQKQTPQVSMAEMKNMIINLYNYSMEGYDESNVQADEPMPYPGSFGDGNDDSTNPKHNPSALEEDSDYDLNSLIGLSKKSRRNETKLESYTDQEEDSDYDLNSLIGLSKKSRRNETKLESYTDQDEDEHDEAVVSKSKSSSKNTSGSFSFLDYYSSFWNRQRTYSTSSTTVSPKPERRKKKNPDRGTGKRKKGKQSKAKEMDLQNNEIIDKEKERKVGSTKQKTRQEKNLDKRRRRKKAKQNMILQKDTLKEENSTELKENSQKDLKPNQKDNRNPKTRPRTPKRRKSIKKERRRRRKHDTREKRETDELDELAELEGKENIHLIEKRDASKKSRVLKERKSRKKTRKYRRRNKNSKYKDIMKKSAGIQELPTDTEEEHLRSLNTPTSSRGNAVARPSPKRQQKTRKRDRTSKRSKGRSRSKRVKLPRRGALAKQAGELDPYVDLGDRIAMDGSPFNMNDDRDKSRSKSFRNKISRSKSKRGKSSRRAQRKRNKKQLQNDAEYQSKRVSRYDDRDRGDGVGGDRRYRDDDGNYYYAVRESDLQYDDERDEFYYHNRRGRGRHSRRHVDDSVDDADGYRRSDRRSRRRHYIGDHDDGGKRVYREKERRYRDEEGYPSRRADDGYRRDSNQLIGDDDIVYYIYPVRRGSSRRRGDLGGDHYQNSGRGSRGHPVDNNRRNDPEPYPYPYPRRDHGYDRGYYYDGDYPRQPVSRWQGRDPYSRGYWRNAPRQGHDRRPYNYGQGSWRDDDDDLYGSSRRPGEEGASGRDGRRLYTTHLSRKDENTPWRGDLDRDRDRDRDTTDLDRRISSRLDTGRYEPGDADRDRGRGRRPPSSLRRNDRYYAELERQRQQDKARMMERLRKLQLQRTAPRVSHKIEVLTRHLRGVLRHYTEAMARSERMYTDIFNGTRFDIMSGMREVYEDLNEANDDIYDAVVRASSTARSIFMKAHRQRAAQIKRQRQEAAQVKGQQPQDEPMMKMRDVESKVKDRDFRQKLLKAQMEKRQLDTRQRHFNMLEMKYNQGKARLQQVKEQFKNHYDHQILLNLFNNMRMSIEYVNEELACSHNLRPLRRNQLYLDQAKKEMNVAKNALFESRDAVQNGQVKLMEIKGLYRKYETEKNRNARRLHRGGNGRGGQRVKRDTDPRELERLKRKTTECRRHSMDLNRTAVFVQRTLVRPIQLGKSAIQRRGRKIPLSQVTPKLVGLLSNVKDMFITLDGLRVYVDAQPTIVLTRRCSDLLVEGSGSGDGEDEEEDECEDEEEDDVKVDNNENGNEGDDFMFEGDEKGTHATRRNNPMKSFGVRLSEYTSQLLSKSGNIHESAHHVLTKASKGLGQRLQVSTLGRDLSLKKDVHNSLATVRSKRDEMTLKLLQVSQTLDRLREIDFDDIKAGAIEALKRAQEESKNKPEVVETTSPVVEPVSPARAVENQNKTKPEETSTWELFRKGKEIESNRNDIKVVQTLALNVLDKSCSKVDQIQSDISVLRQKVEKARNMLSSLQVSTSKTSDSPIPVPIPPPLHPTNPYGLVTTIGICIKPTALDGTVLYLQGNQSASYSLALDGGELTASVYDEDNDKLDSVTLDDYLEKEKWYTIQMTRTGRSLSLRAKSPDGELMKENQEVDQIPLMQPPFAKSFVGGVPGDAEISGDPWQGCVGELVVNGQMLSAFRPSLDGQQPALCTDNCISQDRNLMWNFEGDGFVHYSQPSQEAIEVLSVSFQTTQSTGSILSAVRARRRFHLYVSIENGAVKLETSNEILRSRSDFLNNGTLHQLKVRFESGRIKAELNGDESAFSTERRSRPSPYRTMMEGVLLGSFVSEDRKYLDDRYRPLIGCVGRLVINGDPMLYTDAAEVYRARYGRCQSNSIWQSCASFSQDSVAISLGSVEDSNTISFFVNRNATGPLISLDKEDYYEIDITMTDDSIEVSSESGKAMLVKTEDPGADQGDHFTLISIQDKGKDVVVKAFGQSTEVNYRGWWQGADTSSPHTISFGQARDDESDQPFVGSLSQLLIGDRLYDLMRDFVDNKLESCIRPLQDITPNQISVPDENRFCS